MDNVIERGAENAERSGVVRLPMGHGVGTSARRALDPRVRQKLEHLERAAEGLHLQVLVEGDKLDDVRREMQALAARRAQLRADPRYRAGDAAEAVDDALQADLENDLRRRTATRDALSQRSADASRLVERCRAFLGVGK